MTNEQRYDNGGGPVAEDAVLPRLNGREARLNGRENNTQSRSAGATPAPSSSVVPISAHPKFAARQVSSPIGLSYQGSE